jgi:hypothetical protein
LEGQRQALYTRPGSGPLFTLGISAIFSSLDFYPLTDVDLTFAECITAHPLALSSWGGSR